LRIGNLLTAAIILAGAAVIAGSLSISTCAKDRFDQQSLRKNPVGDFGTGRKLEVQIIDDAPVKFEHLEAPGTMRYPEYPEVFEPDGAQTAPAQSNLTKPETGSGSLPGEGANAQRNGSGRSAITDAKKNYEGRILSSRCSRWHVW
jgi:hypothetical protein